MDSSNATGTVDAPGSDYQIEPPDQPQGASASSDYSIELPEQPANPNIDMSTVAGATPGTPSPAQVGAGGLRQASARRYVEPLSRAQAVTHQADFPNTQEEAAGTEAALTQELGGNGPHPVEQYLRNQDPMLASAPVGAYETGAGLKDVASGIAHKDANAAARGGTRAISGAMEAGTIPFSGAIAQNPVRMAVGYLEGLATGEGAGFVAKKMGMTPDEQEFAHTVGFFMPMAYHTASQVMRDPDINVRLADQSNPNLTRATASQKSWLGGRVAVARVTTPEGSRSGIKVGPFKTEFGNLGKDQGVDFSNQAPGRLPSPEDAVASQQSSQAEDAARRADEINTAAHAIATGEPPPAPPKVPMPAGMDNGLLSQQTVDHAVAAVQALPEEARPAAVQETLGKLSQWFQNVKTAILPNGKVEVVDSPKAAMKLAANTINDAMEAHDQKQEDAKDALEEAQKENAKEEGPSEYQIEQPKPIPETAAVKLARKRLATLPDDATADDMHTALGSLAITSATRDQLVNEAISARPEVKPKPAAVVEAKKGPAPEELQTQAESVKAGNEPFMRVPHGNEYRPKNVDELSRTAVTGAKNKDFNGIYYHSADIPGDLIRKAARDKKNPQAALDALSADWKNQKENPSESVKSDIVQGEPTSATVTNSDKLEGLEGKKVHLNLSDESRIPARHKLVELNSLVPSHRPTANFAPREDYPQEIQERRYESSPDEQLKVQRQANDNKPELMSNTDTTGISGPPIVTSRDAVIDRKLVKKGTVIGGNSRAMTADLLYNSSTNGDNGAEKYRAHIDSHHRDFGFEHEPTSGFQQPVHVLEVEPPSSIEDLRRFGSLVNKPLTQELDVFDKAVSLAKQLSPETLQGISDLVREASTVDHAATFSSILTNQASGRAVVRMLEGDGIVTDRNRGAWVDPATGILNPDARPRLANAMLATLLNSRDLMEQTPAILKQRLLGALGSISSIISRDDDWNIAPAMRAAAKEFGRLTRSGHESVTAGLNQAAMFEQRGLVVTALVKAFDSPVNDLRRAFGLYASDAAMDVPGQAVNPLLMQKPEAWDAFNVAFGTTLTKEQFDSEMAGLRETKAPIAETKPAEGETKYKFGNTQHDISPVSDAGKALEEMRSRVADADLAGNGKDIDGNHLTIRYGIKGDDTSGIRAFIEKQAPFQATLGAVDSFPPSEHSDGAAPLIAPVKAPELARLNEEIAKHGEFTEPSFKEYKPHATVAYVKSEAVQKYVGDKSTEGKTFTVDSITISDRNGNKEEVSLRGTPAAQSLAKGDEVEYTTNKGKKRTGKVAWTDGKKVRIEDGGSQVTKNVDEITRKGTEEAQPARQAPVGDTLVEHLYGSFNRTGAPLSDFHALKKAVAAFDGKEPDQLRMKQAQEAYEAALAWRASDIIAEHPNTPHLAYNQLVELYERQPNMSIRTSTSVQNQAYSTPAPLAFIADKLAGMQKGASVYEPTAGNGMLLIGADQAKTLANEIDQGRGENLKAQGLENVTDHDAMTWAPSERFDAVVANPPFGSIPKPVDFDGYKLVKVEHLIAAKALSVMKDGGKATIILGASREQGEMPANQRPFFNWLYSHYNVVADFELEGEMYSRQGAKWPVRVIAVHGRTNTGKVAPAASSIARLGTWGEVYERASQVLGSDLEGGRRANGVPDRALAGEPTANGTAVSGSPEGTAGVPDTSRPEASLEGHGRGPDSLTGPVRHSGGVPDARVGSADNTVRSDGDVDRSDRLAEGEPAERVLRGSPPEVYGLPSDALADEETQFQVPYRTTSAKKDVGILAPRALKAPMEQAMEQVAARVGDLDEYVTNELGYSSIEEMHRAFMGIQTDAIAMALDQISRQKSVVIGDETGVGKGRVAAAVIRWSEMHGLVPVFVTYNDTLFSAMYSDLHDIGSGGTIVPLMFNAGSAITDPVTGAKILKNPSSMRQALERLAETRELPEGRNAIFATYSQVNTPNRQQQAMRALAHKSIFILDESHNAGGQSNTGEFFQAVLPEAKGAMFMSATWAKRPDNMPLYATKTDMAIAVPDQEKIADAVMRGGVPLQAVLAHQLAQGGQFRRVERSFKGISFEPIVDTEHQAEHEQISDKVTEVLRAIVEADHEFHVTDMPNIKDEVEGEGGGAEDGGSRASQTVNHMEFTSIVHNLVRQLLFTLKADRAADEAIASLKSGRKPLIAFEHTMGSFLDAYVDGNTLRKGDSLAGFNYGTVLKRALDRTRYYIHTDEKGEKTRVEVPVEKLSPETQELYRAAESLIRKLNVDLPASPIDWIRHRLEAEGYTVAEITGRKLAVDYSTNPPTLSEVPREEIEDRFGTATKFNNGRIHALLLNAAGSTGVSLHASEKFLNQEQREMFILQAPGDVNIFMQMLGRIKRTGQVIIPKYKMLMTAIPAELRPGIALTKKMKSLNANTSSNTKSAMMLDAPDMLNKYGDQVVAQYLNDNPGMQDALGLDVSGDDKEVPEELARKATGRSALLPIEGQKQFINSVVEAYADLIDYLDSTGQNDLEPKTYDFDAQERKRQLIYRGTDPTTPFGQDAHYVEYSIKRQGKPYTPEEVAEKVKAGLNGADNSTMAARALRDKLEVPYKEYLAGLTSQHTIERAQMVRQLGVNLLSNFRVGTGLRVEINGEDYNAIVTNIEGAKHPTGNPYAPSSLKFTLAINGALRETRIPGSQIQKVTTTNLGYGSEASPRRLFFDGFGSGRVTAKIITGNLLGAFGSLSKGVKGHVITFSTNSGGNLQGIIMPNKFDPAKHVSDVYAMRTAEGAYQFLQQYGKDRGPSLQSPDGAVWIIGNHNLSISTKPSKAAGGKFFLDPDLRSMVQDHEFVTKAGRMVANIETGKEQRALEIIMRKAALYPALSDQNVARDLEAKILDARKPKPTISSAAFGFMGTQYADQALNAAGRFASKAAVGTFDDIMRGAGIAGRTAKQAGREVMAVLYPAILADPQARDAIGKAIGKPALEQFKASLLLEAVGKMFEGMPQEDWIEFVDRYQNGQDQPTSDLQRAADLIRGVLENQRRQENEAVNLGRPKNDRIALTDKDNYFPNRYEKPPGGEDLMPEEEHISSIAPRLGKRPLAGPKTFLKQQTYTLKRAVQEGAVPLGNPVVMVLRRVQEGSKFVAAHQYMHSLKETGFLSFVRGNKPTPEGYVDIQDNISKVWRPIETGEGDTQFVQAGRWVGEANALRLLNNYLSKDFIRATAIGQTFCAIKNASTGIKLGLSPFHYGVITFWQLASGLSQGLDTFYNQGIRDLNPAKMTEGVAEALKSIYGPVTAIRTGGKMLDYLRNPDGFLASAAGEKFAAQYPDFPHLLELVYSGGLRFGMPDQYRISIADGFANEIASGHLGKATLKAFPWLAQLVTKPLFEHIIPRSKMVFAVQMLSQKLEQYSDAIASGQITEEKLARDVVAAVENRFGEFNYDNLYWNNTLRTAMQLTFRAASWKIGTWRALAEATREQFSSQAFDDHIFDRIDEEGRKAQWARDFTRKLPQMGVNAGGMVAACLMMAVMGSVVARFFAGKWPWESAREDHEKNGLPLLGAMALEAAHPRTGVVNEKTGTPMRFSFPTDLRDYEHALVNPVGYSRGSLSDWLVNSLDTLQNRDVFGNYVFNPADPAWLKFKQGLFYNLKGDFTPISVSNYRDQFGPQDLATRTERMSGVLGGSPPAWDRSKALNRAMDLHKARDPHTPLTPEEQVEKQMTENQKPTRRQVLEAARDRDLTRLDKYVKYELTYTEAKEIFDKYANSNERETLRPILERKRMAAIMAARKRGNGTVVVVPPI